MRAGQELRVHGVSGTPPRDMLYTDPERRVSADRSKTFTKVYFRPNRDPGFEVKGLHWGGLTAGSWISAFWILLAPFAFANAAGWMSQRANRFGRATVRLAGLALTGLMLAQATTVLVALPYVWLDARETLTVLGWDMRIGDGALRLAVTLLGVLVAGLFLLLVWHASTRSHFSPLDGKAHRTLLFGWSVDTLLPPPVKPQPGIDARLPTDPWEDPPSQDLTDGRLWAPHAILHRIRRIHLAAGFGVVALSLAVSSPMRIATVGFLVVLLVTMIGTTAWPKASWVLRVTGLVPWIGIGCLVASLTALWTPDAVRWNPGSIHTVTFAVSAGIGLFALLSVTAGWLPVGAFVIGTLLAAVMGIAVGLALESIMGIRPVLVPNGAGWVAVAALFLLGSLVIVAGLLSVFGEPLPKEDRYLALLRRVTVKAPWLFTWAAFYGLAAGALAVWRVIASGSLQPAALGEPKPGGLVYGAAITVGLLIVAVLWWRVTAGFGWKLGLAVPAGAVLVVAAGRLDFLQFEVAKIRIDLKDDLVQIAVVLAVLIPGLFMLKSIVSGVREGERRRRQVGILWDVGSFWPRWFHPLAPPAYGPVAVTELRDELEREPRDVLAAHSQGSLIAAVALTQFALAEKLPKGFLTYGSQLGILYPKMFPAVGMDRLVHSVRTRLRSRWINLWRDTDPIGGHYVDALGGANWRVLTGTGHSGHELSPEYCQARKQILTGDTERPPDALVAKCWETSAAL